MLQHDKKEASHEKCVRFEISSLSIYCLNFTMCEKCFLFSRYSSVILAHVHTSHIYIPVDKVDVNINANHIPYTHTHTLRIALKFGMHPHKLLPKRNTSMLQTTERYKWEPKINDWKKRALTRKIINKWYNTISAWNCTQKFSVWWVAKNKI